CGALLRPGARFCNNCGNLSNGAASATGRTSDPMATRAGSGRGGGAPGPAGSAIAPAVLARVPETLPIPPGERAAGGSGLTTVHLDAAAAARRGGTVPGGAPGGARGNGGSQPLKLLDDSLAADGQPGYPDDGISWPLPAGIILDGRYRVEGLLRGGDELNLYRVSDLRGYERCWVCHTVYGADAATDRYCQKCGVDMLAHELEVHERRLAPEEVARAEEAAQASRGAASEDPVAPRLFVQSGRAYRVEPRAAKVVAFPRGARLIAGAATDLGLTRSGEHNEDSALVLILDRFHENLALPCGLFAVTDGMGGHASGHKASRMAINVLAHNILRQMMVPAMGAPAERVRDDEVVAGVLREAMREANNTLCAFNQDNQLDAGCTAVSVLIYGETAHIANVGDSRCYVLDEAGLRRVSVDHSLVQTLVAGGMIQPDEVYEHPQRNQIFRSFGDVPDVTIDLFIQQLRPGMRLLLCCDGVWEMVRDAQIEQILRAAPDPQAACDALVEAANRGGGEDNLTAVVIEAR
ncbi:MAG TPA: protein phosphatase 2C domain-containing protein, partial [Ktedonobacterales bacterium]